MAKSDLLTADDLEWEEPHDGRGGGGWGACQRQAEEVKRMVPALRERVGQWAVLDTFEGPSTAPYRASRLKKIFAESETIEARLQFRALKQPNGGSKLYVRLRAA